MSAGKPIQRGTIDIEIARRAAALLEQGERIKLMLFPFDEVVIDANSQEIIDVKKEVEQVCKVFPYDLQGADVISRRWNIRLWLGGKPM